MLVNANTVVHFTSLCINSCDQLQLLILKMFEQILKLTLATMYTFCRSIVHCYFLLTNTTLL